MLTQLKRFPLVANALPTGSALVAIIAVGWVSYSHLVFGTWYPLGQPSRINYCGRDYLPGHDMTFAQVAADGSGLSASASPLQRVLVSPAGAPVYARPMPDAERRISLDAAPLPCTMAIYLKVGSDDYIAYGISGGP